MCMAGIAARVIDGADGQPDYANIYGAAMAFDLDHVPDDAALQGPAGRRAYDARANGVTGIAFDIDSEPPPRAGIRVEIMTVTAPGPAPFWGGAALDASPVHAGHNAFRWEAVGGPLFVDAPPAFDATEILAVQFHVASDLIAAKSFSFCVNNVVALTD